MAIKPSDKYPKTFNFTVSPELQDAIDRVRREQMDRIAASTPQPISEAATIQLDIYIDRTTQKLPRDLSNDESSHLMIHGWVAIDAAKPGKPIPKEQLPRDLSLMQRRS